MDWGGDGWWAGWRSRPMSNFRVMLGPPPPPRRQVEAGQLSRVAALVRGVMEGVAGFAALRVPLRVRLAAGPSWGELEELELDSQGYRIEMK